VPETILDVLSSDHRSVLELLDRLDANSAGALSNSTIEADEQLREQLVIELVRHLVAEEQYLYPLVREQLPDGQRVAELALHADRACERELKPLENPQADAEYLAVALAAIRRRLTAHISEQQDQLFPLLDRSVDHARLVELAEQVLGAEQLAPTRPRALAASNPALNKFSSMVEGFIDHVRDSYRHRGLGADEVE
jgi:hemerythrin-like domain-containing protein